MGCAKFWGDGLSFVCGDHIVQCSECNFVADYLCDFPMGDNKTCDAVLCGNHAHYIGEEKHLCPVHAAIFKASGALIPIRINKVEALNEN